MRKIVTKIQQIVKKKSKLRREKAWIRKMALSAMVFWIGCLHGCACIVGATRGAVEGARRDIAAAQAIAAPGTQDTYWGRELPGQPPQGKGYNYED